MLQKSHATIIKASETVITIQQYAAVFCSLGHGGGKTSPWSQGTLSCALGQPDGAAGLPINIHLTTGVS